MARTKFNKRVVSITGLTFAEFDILWNCLARTKDAMHWDEEEGIATDGGRFMYEMNKDEFEILQKLNI